MKSIEIPLKLWRAGISLNAKSYYIDLLAYGIDNIKGKPATDAIKSELTKHKFLPLKPLIETKDIQTILSVFNNKKKVSDLKGYRLTTVRKKVISSRIKEYGLDICVAVVEYMSKWLKDEKMKENYTPDTIFRPSNFDKYRVAMEIEKKKENTKNSQILTGFKKS